MSAQKKPEEILEEIEALDKRLSEIQNFLRSTKTGNANDSLLTKSNVENAIQLLEEVNPEEKSMLQALKSLIPLTEKTNQELEEKPKQTPPVPENKVAEGDATLERTTWTSKLKTRMSPHKII